MVRIRIFATNEQNKDTVVNWLIEQIIVKGHVGLIDLILQFQNNEVTIQDDDVMSYWDVGWNRNDLCDLFEVKHDTSTMELLKPKYRYWPHYT